MVNIKTLIASALVIGMGVVSAFGQHQVQGGRALDASPQIGSGGLNRPSTPSAGGYGNLYITGNVGLGKSFQGFVPYTATTNMQANLGSFNTLSNFSRDSVGLSQVSAGNVAQALPYFNPSSTILPASAASISGLTVPGSTIPKSAVLARDSGIGNVLVPSAPPRDMNIPALPAGIRDSDILVPLDQPSQLAIQQTAEHLKEMQANAPETVQTEVNDSGRADLLPSELSQQSMLAPPPEAAAAEATQYDELLSQSLNEGDNADFRVMPATEADRNAMADRMIHQANDPLKPKIGSKGQPVKSTGRIDRLSNDSNSNYAKVMRQAETLITKGRFVEAERLFMRASELRPKDPLPVLGRAHALIAAGDLRSASAVLDQAIAMFPTVLYLKLDGVKLLGNKQILDTRLNQVRQAVRTNDDRSLELVAGYVELLAGNRAEAAALFEKAGIAKRRSASTK